MSLILTWLCVFLNIYWFCSLGSKWDIYFGEQHASVFNSYSYIFTWIALNLLNLSFQQSNQIWLYTIPLAPLTIYCFSPKVPWVPGLYSHCAWPLRLSWQQMGYSPQYLPHSVQVMNTQLWAIFPGFFISSYALRLGNAASPDYPIFYVYKSLWYPGNPSHVLNVQACYSISVADRFTQLSFWTYMA